MERLTKYVAGVAHGAEGRTAESLNGSYCRGEFEATAIVDRLAAYEDTGLEPEDLKRAVNEDAVLKLAGQALGITPDRLRELAQAAQKGGGQPRRSHRKVPENQGGGQHGQAENLRGAGDRSGRGI